jgi:hypothetical protein
MITAIFSSLAGKNNHIVGSIISFTKAVTILDAAWPITNAIDSPIIPIVIRKAMYSFLRDFFSVGGCSVN